MKRILFIVLFMTVSMTSLYAQNKGDVFLGGIVGGGTSTNFLNGESGSTIANVNATLEIGYFATDELKIGAEIGYALTAGDTDVHALMIGPNIAYYTKLAEKLYYTPSLSVCFALGIADGISMPGFGVGLNLFSMEFRPTRRFGFTASLGSINYVALTKEEITSSTLGVNIGINPSVGFKYYF